MYNDDDIIAWAKKFSAEAPTVAPVPHKDVSGLLERMRGGTLTQESGGNYQARNARTGALGGFQVMPANIPHWTKTYLGRSYTPDEFARDPKAQESVFKGEMGKYLRKARSIAPDDDTAIRMAAAAWYGGEGAMRRYDDPRRFRSNEPSFREYTQSVLKRSKPSGVANGNPGMSDDEISRIFQDVDKVLGGNNDQDVFAEVDKVLAMPIGVQPAPESEPTIAMQREAAADPKVKSRNGVLLNAGETPNAAEWQGFGAHKTQDGRTIMVHQDNAKKNLKLKTPEDINMFLEHNPDSVERIVGIVDPVGNDTGGGQPVVTAQVDGKEAASAVVTNPDAAEHQAEVYQEQFPKAQIGVTTTDDIVKQRQVQGGRSAVSKKAALRTPPALGNFTVDTSGAGTDLNDPNVQAALNAYPQLDEQENVSDTKEVKGGLRAIPRKQVGKPTDDLNRVVSTFYPTSAKDDRDAAIQAVVDAGEQWGVSEQEAAKYVDSLNRPLAQGWKPGTGIQITYKDIAKIRGEDTVKADIAIEQAQARTENPQPNLDVSPKGFVVTPQDIKDYTKGSRYGGDVTAAVAGSLIGSLGDVAAIIPGLLSLNPATRSAEQILTNGGARSDVKVNEGEYIERAREFYNNTQAIKEGTRLKDSPVTSTIIDLGAALPKLAVLSASAGGLIAGLAIEGAGLSGIRKDNPSSVIGNAASGALNGLVFEIVPNAAKVIKNPFLRNGTEVAAISGSTYALGKLSGVPDEENFAASLAMGVMHLYGSYKKALVGKTIDARDESGNRLVVKVTEDNKIVTVAPETKADIELFIPKNFKAYAEKDARIQAEKQAAENPMFKDVGVEQGEPTYKGEAIKEQRNLETRPENLNPTTLRNLAEGKNIAVPKDAFEGLPEAELQTIRDQINAGTFESTVPKVEPQEKGFEVVGPEDVVRATSVVPPVEAKPELPVGEGKLKERKTIKTAHEFGLINKNKTTGEVRYYKEKQNEPTERAAQDYVEKVGFTNAFNEAVLPSAGRNVDSEARQMAVIQLLSQQAEAARNAGDMKAFDAYEAQTQAVLRALAPEATEAGQFIQQLSRWKITNPATILARVKLDRIQNGLDATISAEQQKALVDTSARLQEAQKTIDKMEARLSESETEAAAMKTRAETAESKIETLRPFIEKAEKFVAKIDERANAARERIKARGNVLAAGLDPLVLKDFADIGASHIAHLGLDFAKFSDAMVTEFGEKIKPHLAEIWKKARGLHDRSEDAGLKAAKTRLRNQITDLENAINTKTKIVLSKTSIPLDAEAMKLQIKRDALRKEYQTLFPKVSRSLSVEAKQNLYKKNLAKQIKELDQRIKTGEATPTRGKLPTTPAINRLKAQRDALKEQLPKIEKTISDAQYNKTRAESLKKQIADLDTQIQTGNRIVRETTARKLSPEVGKLIAHRDDLKQQFTDMFGKPGMSDVARLKAYKTRTENRIIELTKQLEEHQFRTKPKRPGVTLDQKAQAMKAELDALKGKVNEAVRDEKKASKQEAFTTKARELSPDVDKAILEGAMARRDGATSFDEITGILRQKFPDRFKPEKSDTPEQRKNKQEDLINTIAESVKLYQGVNKAQFAERQAKRDADKGINAETRKALEQAKRVRAETTKSLTKLVQQATRPPGGVLHAAAQVSRASKVALIQTAATNIISTKAEQTFANKPIDTMDIALQRIFKGLKNEGLDKDASIATAWWTPKAKETVYDEGVTEYGKGLSKHEILLKVIDEHPEYFAKFFGDFSPDFHTGVSKTLDKVMIPMRIQEFFMRDSAAVKALAQRASMKGLDFKKIIESGDYSSFTKADLDFALNEALSLTYAIKPKRGGGITDTTFATINSAIRSSGMLDLMGAESAPFLNFMYNTINKYKTKLPGIAQVRLVGKTVSEAQRLKLEGETPDYIKEAIRNKWTSRQIANQMWGVITFGAAIAMVKNLGDKDEWYKLKIPFTTGYGEKTEQYPDGEPLYFDVRTQPLFSPFVFVANKMNRLAKGKDMFTYGDYADELTEAFLGTSYRSTFDQNAGFQTIKYAGKTALDTAKGDDTERNAERLSYFFRKWLGNEVGTMTNFLQFKTFKDIAAQFDTKEQVPLNLDAAPFTEGLDRRLPESRRILQDIIKMQVEARKNFATDKETSRNPVPILKIIGFNLVDGATLRPEPTQAEILARKLSYGSSTYKRPELPDEKRDAAIKRDFRKAGEKLQPKTPEAEELKDKLKTFDTDLTSGQIGYATRTLFTSDLEDNFKGLSAKNKNASAVWAAATDAEKAKLRPIYTEKLTNILRDKKATAAEKAFAQEQIDKYGLSGTENKAPQRPNGRPDRPKRPSF